MWSRRGRHICHQHGGALTQLLQERHHICQADGKKKGPGHGLAGSIEDRRDRIGERLAGSEGVSGDTSIRRETS